MSKKNNDKSLVEIFDEYVEDDYYTPGYGVWKYASRTAMCPCCDEPIAIIRYKQLDRYNADWFFAEHYCNICMYLRTYGVDGGFTKKNVKKLVNDWRFIE